MPGIEDDAPRLSELVRIMQDFRAEFRHFAESVVRKDVYAVERAAFEMQLNVLQREIARVDKEIDRIDKELADHHTEHKNYGIRLTSAWITAGFSLVVGLVLAVVK